MPLPGVVPFPPEFAARYRERGYWLDRSLRAEFADVFTRHANRVALLDGDRAFTYA
jgi:2,3-dihydroxybenzoate-AMP ligase